MGGQQKLKYLNINFTINVKYLDINYPYLQSFIRHSLNTNYNYQLSYKEGNHSDFSDLYNTEKYPYPTKFRYNTNYEESPALFLQRNKYYKFIIQSGYYPFFIFKTPENYDISNTIVNYDNSYISGTIFNGVFILITYDDIFVDNSKLYYGSENVGEFEIYNLDVFIKPFFIN